MPQVPQVGLVVGGVAMAAPVVALVGLVVEPSVEAVVVLLRWVLALGLNEAFPAL